MTYIQEQVSKKKQAFEKLESLHLDLPDDFDADAELVAAMEAKYGTHQETNKIFLNLKYLF